MSKITDIAKEWVGTPWKHGQSTKHYGCDCVGFLLGIGKEAGVLPPETTLGNYHRIPRFDQIATTFDGMSQFYPVESYQQDDVLLLKIHNIAGHVALVADNDTIIHADNVRGVVQIPIGFWLHKIYKIYRICPPHL
jgi:cell wall-associated NlpC family hydrolase